MHKIDTINNDGQEATPTAAAATAMHKCCITSYPVLYFFALLAKIALASFNLKYTQAA